MPLKIGDIKGIELNGRKVACVVMGRRHDYLQVVTITGETVTINTNTPYSIVRLEPEVRAIFEKMSREAKQIESRVQTIEKMNKEIQEIEQRVRKETVKMQEVTGGLTQREFKDEIYKNIPGRIQRELDAYWFNFYMQEKAGEIKIYLSKSIDIKKYTQPGDYDFVYAEYDNTIHINSRGSKDYKELVSRYSREDAVIKDQKGMKVTQSRGLDLGDKEWLTYSHGQELHIKTKEGLTKDLAKRIGLSLKIN